MSLFRLNMNKSWWIKRWRRASVVAALVCEFYGLVARATITIYSNCGVCKTNGGAPLNSYRSQHQKVVIERDFRKVGFTIYKIIVSKNY